MDSSILTTPCRLVAFSGGVLHLRFLEADMRVCFWPEPLLEVKAEGFSQWFDGSAPGADLLERVRKDLTKTLAQSGAVLTVEYHP